VRLVRVAAAREIGHHSLVRSAGIQTGSRSRATTVACLIAVAIACVGCSSADKSQASSATDSTSSTTVRTSGVVQPANRFAVRYVLGNKRAKPCDSGLVSDGQGDCLRLGQAIVSTADVASAKAGVDPTSSQWVVFVTLDAAGNARWKELLRSGAMTDVAMLVDGHVESWVSVPGFKNPDPLDLRVRIEGNISEARAKQIAAELTP
jgi:preprotein translocase subunit SecD